MNRKDYGPSRRQSGDPFTDSFDTADLKDAKALLDELK